MPKKSKGKGESVPTNNDGEVPTSLGGNTEEFDSNNILEDWPQLKEINIQDYFTQGWKPRVKTKPDGNRFMSIRHKWKDEETEQWHEEEKGLGPYDPEKWELLLSMCPTKTGFPKSYMPRKEPSILKTKLSSPKPIPPTIPLDSDLIEYYLYFQSKGYKGDMGDWIKECARNYLVGNGLEVVVVKRVGENNG